MIKISVIDADKARKDIEQAISEFMTDKFVTVGIHEDTGQHESDDITNAALGAVHEFGADIEHPGGTSYGYASKAAANRNEIRFLKPGKGYMVLGVTGPHTTSIPARHGLTPAYSPATLIFIHHRKVSRSG